MLRSPDSPRGLAILLTPILFTAFLILPIVGQYFELRIYSGIEEKRTNIPFPGFPTDLASLDAFPAAFDAYYNDQFGFRSDLIALHNLFFYATTHSLPGNRVYAGKGPWLFGKFDGALLSFQHRLPLLTPAGLDVMAHRLMQRQQWLEAQGRAYLFFVTPSKSTIYPDRVPDRLRIAASSTRLEQASSYFAKLPHLPFLDTTAALSKARRLALERSADVELFHYTDTHWNMLGAYIAYEDVLARTQKLYPSGYDVPQALGLELFYFTAKPGVPGDLSRMAGIQPLVSETDLVSLNPFLHNVSEEIPGIGLRSFHFTSRLDALPDLLLFHDSFGENLRLPFSNSAKESYFLWTHEFLIERIRDYAPRIVLTQITERFFNQQELTNPVPIRLLEADQVAEDWQNRGDPALQEIRFDSGLTCQVGEIRISEQDVEIRIIWRADRDLTLDGAFETYLRRDGWNWYHHNRQTQCPGKSTISSGSIWEDRIVFSAEEFKPCEEFVLRVLDSTGHPLLGRRNANDEAKTDFVVPRERFLRTQHGPGR